MMQGSGGGSTGAPMVGLGQPQQRMMSGEEKEKRRKLASTAAAASKKLPSPKEMVAHYESKGMQPQEASLKVIDDLQNLLLRVVTTKKNSTSSIGGGGGDINARILSRLEAKLDSKPGYPQTLAIGVLSGAVFSALPHVAHIWNSVRSSTSSSSSS